MPYIEQLSEKEKINIYVDEETYSTLEHDMDVFEVCRKKNGEVNRNDFLSRLIVNYGKQYRDAVSEVYDGLKSTLKEYWPKGQYYHDLMIADILAITNKEPREIKDRTDRVIAFRPQKKNTDLQFELEDISVYLSGREGISVSDYFRSLLEAYCRLVQCEREKIILRKTYSEIARAVREKKLLQITAVSGETFRCIPYALVPNRARQHNYLIGIVDGQVVPRILSRISHVRVLNEKGTVPEELREVLKERRKNPEFALQDEQDIYVLFNAQGLEELKLMKHGRPRMLPENTEVPEMIRKQAEAMSRLQDEDLQLRVFSGTEIQAYFYFRRFGQDAYVIAPESLNVLLRDFFAAASGRYSH